jgi:hypothetical protein
MRTLLVCPPQAHPTQPFLCLPALTAYLRENGFPDTHQRDLNLEAHEWFLRRDRLARSRDRVRSAFAELPRDRPLPLPQMDRFRVLAEAAASADGVVDGIEHALRTLRDEELFYDYDGYLAAVKLLDRAFRLISAEHYPSSLTPHNYTLKHSIEREAEVLAAVFDEEANFFCEYFREKALPEILELAPDLLGISLTYTSQVIPGLALARMVKQARRRSTSRSAAGRSPTSARDARSGKVFGVVDSVIVLEGEGPLHELAKNVAAGKEKPADGIGNCIWKDGERVVVNPPASPLSIESLPTPDFDGMPMERYLSPKLALPLAITRGCYWEKCAFCTLYKVIGPGFRQRTLDQVMDDIEAVTKRWKSDVIYFVVEDMPPPLFKQLPAALKARGISVKWWTDARLERNLFTDELCRDLYASGCRRIAFGFESASQRLLDLMEKGTSIDEADGILRRLAAAGISNTLYTMIGFRPRPSRRRSSRSVAARHKDVVDEVSLRIFYVDHLSKVFEHPDHYDVKQLLQDPRKDLQVYYDWIPGSGMDRREARELFFEFMKSLREEFPLFRGDNLLLFELKSHYFLYLCKFGNLDFLRDKQAVAVGEAPPADFVAARPRLPDGNALIDLPYDLRTISDTLNEAECAVLKPRYQSGNSRRFREMAPRVPRRRPRLPRGLPRALVDLQIGKDAARLLRAADGSRTVATSSPTSRDAAPEGRALPARPLHARPPHRLRVGARRTA